MTGDTVIRLRTVEAAGLLSVTPNMLRDWQRLFDFPTSHPGPGGHRQFSWAEIVALRGALNTEHSVASAIAAARAAVSHGSAEALYDAFITTDVERCERALAAALTVRSTEDAVEAVLVRALDLVDRAHGADSAAWAFAAEFSGQWLRGAMERTVAGRGLGAILVGDASRDQLGPDAVYISSLKLLCRSTGCEVVSVPVREPCRLGHAVAEHRPDLLVIAGAEMDDETVVRWAYDARASIGPVLTTCYRCDPRRLQFFPHVSSPLPTDPLAARERLLELIERSHFPSDSN
jgi:MerR family transcriptional regulator, light-induced transcriptional regulator